MKKIYFLIVAAFVAMLVACAGGNEQADGKLYVVATTGMVADLVQNIGGDTVRVEALMGAGVDPHLYQASARDNAKMANAKVIFYNGLHLEGKMTDIFERMEGTKPTVAIGEAVPESIRLASEDYADEYDPHVWFDVSAWSSAIVGVAAALSEADPENAGAYASNAAVYAEELAALDAYVRTRASEVPEEQRVLITAHDAFRYFGQAYGFEVRGIQGISTTTEAGTGDIETLATFIAEREIPAIFVETSVPVRYIESLQAAVRAKGAEVVIGGELFSDAMGDAGTVEGTYVGMVRHNIDTIVGALAGGESES